MLIIVDPSFEFRAITGSILLILLMSLSFCVSISFASNSFQILFKCKPTISTNVTCLNDFAVLLSLTLYAWIARLVLESFARSCLGGIFIIIISVLFYFCINWVIITKIPLPLLLFLSLSFIPPFITSTSFIPRHIT